MRGPRLHKGKVVFDGAGGELASPVPEPQATPDMPRYRVHGLTQVGRCIFEGPDEIIVYLAWPTEAFEAVNQPAEAVVAYAVANRGRTDMLPSPWCMYRRGLFLPALKGTSCGVRTVCRGHPRPTRPATMCRSIAPSTRTPSRPRWPSVTGRRPGTPGSVPVSTRSGFSTHVGRAKPLPSRR